MINWAELDTEGTTVVNFDNSSLTIDKDSDGLFYVLPEFAWEDDGIFCPNVESLMICLLMFGITE